MKSSKLWKVIWIVGIYAILLVILYLVILYKVEWENKDLNTYLYVYDCNHNLCTSTTIQKDYYSKILCKDKLCPYIDSIIGNNLILKRENTSWIYNYISDEIINDTYNYYRYIGDNMYVVSNDFDKYGIIDGEGNIVVDLKYNYIDDYMDGIISYIKNNAYGIISLDGKYKIDSIYEDVVLINDKIFAGRKDNIYQLHSYYDINSDNSNKYNYVYADSNVILTINNKKIDILDNNLNSTLLMKIDCFYEYISEKERKSLDIYSDDKYIYFKVFINSSEYKEYRYSIVDKKLV